MTFWIEKDEKAAPAGVSYIEVIIVWPHRIHRHCLCTNWKEYEQNPDKPI
jgi:hypothetical protein